MAGSILAEVIYSWTTL